jgi:DNA-binding PadR family transcriptional regulator
MRSGKTPEQDRRRAEASTTGGLKPAGYAWNGNVRDGNAARLHVAGGLQPAGLLDSIYPLQIYPLWIISAMLRPAVFHILLALSAGDRHGLGIADEIEEASGGTMQLGPGTLYRSLAEMVDAGLIRSVKGHAESDPRRKPYRITPAGRAALSAEASRLARLVGAARARKVLVDPV